MKLATKSAVIAALLAALVLGAHAADKITITDEDDSAPMETAKTETADAAEAAPSSDDSPATGDADLSTAPATYDDELFHAVNAVMRGWDDDFFSSRPLFNSLFRPRIASSQLCRHSRTLRRDLGLRTTSLDHEWKITAAMAGIPRDNVSIEVSPAGVLEVVGTISSGDDKCATTTTLSGSLQLPYGTSADAVSAVYRDGLLTVTVAKPEITAPKKVALA